MANATINVKINGNSTSAQTAIDQVGQKLDSVLGKKMSGIAKKMMNVLPMAGAAAGVGLVATEVSHLAGKVTDVSDKYALMKARIDLINDGQQTTAELMDKIYASAERSRGSYMDMADSVGKLNMLAKDAFSSNDEAIVFVEQMNKQFKIGGASIQEQTAAMYQLTQAMASGRLQGDEFRSIMENAPMLAQSIANEFGVGVGELRAMSSEGVITADIIKNAMFNSAEETNAKFAELPMTFAEVSTQIANSAIQAFQPVLEQLSSMTATDEFKTTLEGIGTAFRGLGVAAQVAIGTIKVSFSAASVVVKTLVSAVKSLSSVITGIGPPAIATFAGITAYIVATKVATAAFSTAVTVATVVQKSCALATNAWKVATTACSTAMSGLRIAIATCAISGGVLRGVMVGMSVAFRAVRTGVISLVSAQKVLNLVMRANPIGIVVSVLAVLASVLGIASAAANGFGETMKAVWEGLVNTVAWAINKIIGLINDLINALNAIGDKLGQVFDFDYSKIENIAEISSEQVYSFAGAVENLASTFAGADIETPEVDAGGSGSGGGGGKGGHGSGGGGGGGNNLAEEAKNLHKSIVDEWSNMFKTRSELNDKWLKEELEELDKSKDANVDYEKDKTMIMEMYAKKREQALHEEAKRQRELMNSIRDMTLDFNFATLTTDSTGAQSPTAKLMKEHESAINDITDKWQKFSDNYAEMTNLEQAAYKKMLDERGIAYEVNANNELSFERQKNAELLAEQEKYNKQREELLRTQSEVEWEIQEALRTQNFEALQAALTEEYVATADHYELKKQLLADYQQAVQDSYWNNQEMMYSGMKAGIDSLRESISGMLQGTTSLITAFQNLGKAILKTVADYTAKWIAARVQQAVFGKMMQSQETASSIAAANAQLPAWTSLAQQVSMATFGASAAAGMAVWSASTAAGTAASAIQNAASIGGASSGAQFNYFASRPRVHLAEGGLAHGRTYAEIGEGKYPEAVLPLSDETYEAMGQGIARANGNSGGAVTLNISAMDADSFSGWLESKAGRALRQYLYDQDREFTGTAGVW
ncbi:tape measure protein [Colibacter massiliensis]|uniref:tape measure protein n=1 Tax=Colibacter massiliensis TaxID=1852379 RepID=UPI003F932A40